MDARRSTRSVKNPTSTSSPLVEKTPPAASSSPAKRAAEPVAQVQKRRKMNTDGAEESRKKNDGEDKSEKNNVGGDKSEGKKKKKKKKQVKEGEKKKRKDNGEGESNGVLNEKSKSKNKKKKPKSTTTNASEKKVGFDLFAESISSKGHWIKPPPVVESFLNSTRAKRLVEPSKVAAFENKWQGMLVAETEVFVQRTELVAEWTKMVLEGFRSPASS